MHHITEHLPHHKHEAEKKKVTTTTTRTATPTTTTTHEEHKKIEHHKKPVESHEFKKVEPHKHKTELEHEKKHKIKEHGHEHEKVHKQHLGTGYEYETYKTHKHEIPITHEHHHGETHIKHERERMSADEYGNMYRSGVDPLQNREIACETHEQGAVIREKFSETPVVKEVIQPVELHKVQPVIHREREQKEIRHVFEPHKEFAVQEAKIHHRERDIDLGVRREGTTLETSRSVGHAPHIESTREVVGTERQHQDLPVRVEEHVHKVVEEHVHPVIYKEVLKPKVLEETHHIYEKVKESPIETYVEVKDRGFERGAHEELDVAKREFFAHESARGIACPLHHEHGHVAHVHEHRHDVSPKHLHEHKPLKAHKSEEFKHKHEHKHKHEEKLHKEKALKREIEKKEKKKKPKVSAPFHVTPVSHAEPIIGHHQNIGGHHIPATSVPLQQQGSIYDSALAAAPMGKHSARDTTFVHTVSDKKIAEKEARRTGLATPPGHHNVV